MPAMPFDSQPSRRHVLQVLAGGALLAGGVAPTAAAEQRIGSLIVEAQKLPAISQRVDFIAAALKGTRYRGYTLIGSPRRAMYAGAAYRPRLASRIRTPESSWMQSMLPAAT